MDSDAILRDVDAVLARAVLAPAAGRDAALGAVCAILRDRVPHYDWVGFYLVDPDAPRELVLGPYVGAPTDHARIPFGRGICGQAADRGETFVVQDVREESNYLSCSVHVRSEIVVPLVVSRPDGAATGGAVVVGELDIDSHALAPFTPADRALLEAIAARLAPLVAADAE